MSTTESPLEGDLTSPRTRSTSSASSLVLFLGPLSRFPSLLIENKGSWGDVLWDRLFLDPVDVEGVAGGDDKDEDAEGLYEYEAKGLEDDDEEEGF